MPTLSQKLQDAIPNRPDLVQAVEDLETRERRLQAENARIERNYRWACRVLNRLAQPEQENFLND